MPDVSTFSLPSFTVIIETLKFLFYVYTIGVGNDRTKTFKSFSIDSRSKTSFEVANSLWDLVGEGFEKEK